MEIISAKISKENLECLETILDVLEKCKNKPVFLVDGAPWYKEVLKRIKIRDESKRKEKYCKIFSD